MSIIDNLLQEQTKRLDEHQPGEKSTTIGGESVDLADAQTAQTYDDTFLTSEATRYGIPLGAERREAREVGQTWAMEIIKNAIYDQVAGGERVYEAPDGEELDEVTAVFANIVDDILVGPHLMSLDFSDLLSSAIADMVDVGLGYWEPIGSSNDDLPVAALKPVDALTVRHNISRSGDYEEPPFYQAPFRTMGGDAISIGSVEPAELDREDLVVMRYPGSQRSNEVYPRPPAMQVKRTLELLAYSTTHHLRYYNDNEIPEGFLQVMQAGETDLKKIKGEISAAAGDPRKTSVIGGEGPAKWISMGDSAINLNVIEEQKWFLQLCLAAFGAGKAELGLIEDVNRANGEVEQTRVFKRIAKPFVETFEDAVNRQILTQFELYNTLDQPFEFRMRYTDPQEERRREEQLRQRFEAGALPYAEYRRMIGEDPGETVVDIDGTPVDYGLHPRFVTEQLIRDARSGDVAGEGDDEGGDDGDEDAPFA